ncbi:alpha/beta hydrolase [Hoyosella sp. G463]|uniref:Alpha/beta hydrolase n=1 Tax=Lolliginicoccus lacisalsi TaxID=2742202 RepID=A0A927J9V4_9ACTN|nr:alpha/beta hydrolase [Lolliginicoccus lacisalsi]MBD8505361.1 alpha/beta hydrolase [Lolliginicoccus lacisalsi]
MRIAALLPGTGSRAAFVQRAFAGPLAAAGITLVAIEPDPTNLIESALTELDTLAATASELLVGGISLGAALATTWAARNPGRATGILAALPAWIGSSAGAPAALSATITANALDKDGLEATIAGMRATSPAWLADELEASWRQLWPGLPGSLRAAAAFADLDAQVLSRVDCPVGIAAATDDPIHPRAAAEEWSKHLRRCHIETLPLAWIGEDPAALGTASLAALAALGGR